MTTITSPEQLLVFIQTNIDKSEFNFFMNCCISKWIDIKPECDKIDVIVNNVSKQYNISITELLWDIKQIIPRSIMFHTIKKELPKLSYEAIGDIFERQKSYVFKANEEAKNYAAGEQPKDALNGQPDSPQVCTEYDISDSQKLFEFIRDNMHLPAFAGYVNSCVDKWINVKTECDALDIIMNGICLNYKISINELLWDKKQTGPRALMFYIVKKAITRLSFEAIGDIFKRQKSYVFKSFDEAKFTVERHCHKPAVIAFNDVRNQLKLNNLLPDSFDENPETA